MFCYCINKNWNGNHFITVVANSTEPYSNESWDIFVKELTEITKKYLSRWTVEIVDGRHADHRGFREQQVNKVLYSIDDRFQDAIVFDAKDFLLRVADLSTFKIDDYYKVIDWIPEERLIDRYPKSHTLLDQDMSHIPAIYNLTPWIWNVDQLNQYWSYMTNKFGDYHEWGKDDYKGGGEIDSYFAYTYCNPDKTVKFSSLDDNHTLINGGWSGQSYEGMIEQSAHFDYFTNRIVWKHHRNLKDSRCLEVTKSVLLEYGIEQEIIESVFN
jgi:hypothetical protein